MKKMLLVALASTVLATPALAADRSWYVGIEGGLMFPRDENIDVSFDDDILAPALVGPASVGPQATINGLFDVSYKTGRDLSLIAGYDFGLFRVEAELANKRARHDDYNVFFEGGDYDADGYTRVNSLMANFLLDVPGGNRWSLYAGPGIGFANVKMKLGIDGEFGETIKDSGLALQGIAGVRYAVSDNIDVGLKYRYFEATKIRENSEEFCIASDSCTYKTRFRSHSLLASVIYNFAPPAPVAPAYVAPAPAPAPVATQTCYDGSVIEASATCPTPPAPEPTPTPERG